jgi:EmrB/QacA subfamily drug resistance transporter
MQNSEPNRLKWFSLLILSLALAIIVIDGTVLNVSQKYVIQDLSTDLKTVQWAFTSYALVLAALTILGGRLGDLFGRRKAFILGAIIFAVGSAMTAFSKNSFDLILGWSIVEGIGAALMVPASSALIVSNFEGKERGVAFGIYGATAGAASSFGPILGGFFASTIGWRWAFGINVVIAALLVLGSFVVKDNKKHYPKIVYLDFIGVFLSSIGLSAVMYGIIESATYGWFVAKQNWQGLDLFNISISFWSILFGLILLVSFIYYEIKLEKFGKSPLVSMSIFKNSQFTFGVGTLAALFSGFSGLITYGVVFFFLIVRGMSAFETGLALIPFSLATFIMAPLASKIGDKIGQRNLVLLGLAINAVGNLCIYNTITYEATSNNFILPFLVTGIGFGMIVAQLNNIVLSSVEVSQAGVASGINSSIREVGRALGVSIIGAAFITSIASGVVLNINSQSENDIPNNIKIAIVQKFENGQSELGREDFKSDQKLLQEAAAKGINIANVNIANEYIVTNRRINNNIKEQVNRAITDSAKVTILYTLGFTLLAICLAFGIKNSVS